MLEEEAGGVSVTNAVVGVAALVERVAEHGSQQRHASAHQQARQLAELDVGEAVAAEGEAAPVADRDEARGARLLRRDHGLGDAPQTEVHGLLLEALSLAEALREHQRVGAQVVQHVPEQHAVAVQEVAPF